jgi:uncharacterized membrane protein YeiB
VANVYYFAMPFSTHHDPTLAPGSGPVDVVIWALTYLFFDNKFLPVFSMPFGAGIILMTESAKAKGRPLTNYLAQSILMSLVFYGYGLGLYGSMTRLGQASIAFGVVLLQLVWSEMWLQRFRFGPVEWVWRCLTYWRHQPMVRSAPPTPESADGE